MVANKKITGRATSLPAGLAIGAVCSLAATLVLTAILAKLVEAETLPVEKVGYGIMVLLIVSSFAGAMISFGRIKPARTSVSPARQNAGETKSRDGQSPSRCSF